MEIETLILMNWAKQIDNNVVSLEKWPNEETFYKIRDIYHIWEGEDKVKNLYKNKSNIIKCISFNVNTTIGMIQTFNLPISEYKNLLRNQNLEKLI